MIKPFLECPRFDFCSVNACPLDPQIKESLEDDPETECKALLSVRKKIAEKYQLSNQGMTLKELQREARRIRAKMQWQKLSNEEKQKRINQLIPFASKTA